MGHIIHREFLPGVIQRESSYKGTHRPRTTVLEHDCRGHIGRGHIVMAITFIELLCLAPISPQKRKKVEILPKSREYFVPPGLDLIGLRLL
jgi:hypothetical protein